MARDFTIIGRRAMDADPVRVRPVERNDAPAWLRLRCELWPGAEVDHASEIERYFAGPVPGLEAVLLAEIASEPVGFAELSIRAYAEGCTTEGVGYLEGWYVVPNCRESGVGRALLLASEQWARGRGCREFASDTQAENELACQAHRGCGFEEVGLVRCFRKAL